MSALQELPKCATCGGKVGTSKAAMRRGGVRRCVSCAVKATAPPRPVRDLTGQSFGSWLVVGPRSKLGRGPAWFCKCECGESRPVRAAQLMNGTSTSCGCSRFTGSFHPLYNTWIGMMRRCENPEAREFRLYGGRGIKVCERWRDSMQDFYADMGPKPTPEHQIDRIDNDGDYEPGNCRWATVTQQARNKRTNVLLEVNGQRRCVSEWSEISGVAPGVVSARLRKGWPAEKAIFTPTSKVGTDKAGGR